MPRKAKKEMRRAEKRALKTEKRKRQTLLLGMESTIEERTGEEKEVVLEEEEKREEHGDEETGTGGGAEGENGEARNFPEWRLCLRRIVNHCIFQVCARSHDVEIRGTGRGGGGER